MRWQNRKVLVTGGTGFIGSALVERLLELGAEVGVADKIFLHGNSELYDAKMKRLRGIYQKAGVERPDITIIDLAYEAHRFEILCEEYDTVFHLAALFGGREFVETRQADCAKMLAVDHNVIDSAQRAGVERFHYASSACVYPNSLQAKEGYLLKEDDALSTGEGFKGSDNLYGWAKLMGELQMKVYHDERGMKTSACRYLTVYGEGEMDTSHAIPTLIERTLDGQEPFEIWGDGHQKRGFTYVSDIVEGSIRACEMVEDGTPINLGGDKSYQIIDVASGIWAAAGWNPKAVKYLRDKPEGPRDRLLDTRRAREMLGWKPEVGLAEGLRRTVAWHRRMRGTMVEAT